MESLKDISTGIQSVPGYAVIQYRVFAITPTDDGASKPPHIVDRRSLDRAQHALIDAGHLACGDYDTGALWVFQNKRDNDTMQELPEGLEPPALDGLALTPVWSGLLKVSDVPRARLKAVLAAGTTKPPADATSRGASTLKKVILDAKQPESIASNSTVSGTDASLADLDPTYVLPCFMTAVEASISYQLTKKLGFIPLNARTWVASEQSTGLLTPLSIDQKSHRSLILVSLTAYVTTAGTLVLLIATTPRPDMRPLSSPIKLGSPSIVRLAPGGVLALAIGSGEEMVSPLPSTSPTQRHEMSSFPQDFLRDFHWKAAVKAWLKLRGVKLECFDHGWSAVRLTRDAATVEMNSRGNVQCLWPSALCFSYSSPDSKGSIGDPRPDEEHEGLSWFYKHESQSLDPIDRTVGWYTDRIDRDRARDARRVAAAAAASVAVSQSQTPMGDHSLMFPPSPFYARTDLQAAAGVYPTPPDGVLPAGNVAMSDGAGLLPHTGNNLRVNDMHGRAEDASLTSGVTPAMNDDSGLFGAMDMDDDNFGGNELSDADFNFFDEPDPDTFPEPDAGADGVVDATVSGVDAAASTSEGMNRTDTSAAGGKAQSLTVVDDEIDSGLDTTPNPPIKAEQNTESSAAGLIEELDPHARGSGENQDRDSTSNQPVSPSLARRQLLELDSQGHRSDDAFPARAENGKVKDEQYRKVDFDMSITAADSRYAAGGTFDYPLDGSNLAAITSRGTNRGSSTPARISHDSSFIRREDHSKTSGRIPASLTNIGRLDAMNDSDSDEMSTVDSVDEGALWDHQHVTSTTLDPLPRKRARLDDHKSPISLSPKDAQHDSQILGLDALASQIDHDAVLYTLSSDCDDRDLSNLPSPGAFSKKGFLTSPRLAAAQSPPPKTRESKDFSLLPGTAQISVAQLVADQCAFSNSMVSLDGLSVAVISTISPEDSEVARQLPHEIQCVLTSMFQDAISLDLHRYAQIQDASFEPPPGSKLPPRPPQRKVGTGSQGSDGALATPLFLVNPQHVRVRRGDSLWDLLPPALSFWEPLGLGPANGPKDVLAYCIFPENDMLRGSLSDFLDAVGSAYEAAKLGTHLRGLPANGVASDLIPVAMADSTSKSYGAAIDALRKVCNQVGTSLAQLDLDACSQALQDTGQSKIDEDRCSVNSLVIYIVNPFERFCAIRDICHCFWKLSESYERGCRLASPVEEKPKLVLQIVPIRAIASTKAPVVLNPREYSAFAREVYDRCPPVQSNLSESALSICSAPAVQLEETIPRSIPFKLTADSPGELLHDCSHIHVGYATSWNGDWLTAAWTDNFGKYQTTSSYSLSGGRQFGDIAKDIWQATLGIIQSRKVTWRLTIARAGVMEREEFEAWVPLIAASNAFPVGTVLMSVNIRPPYSLSQTSLQDTQHMGSSTPVSTPQILSPADPSTGAAVTPSDALQDATNDPDAHLVDINDEIWGVVLGHRLNNSNSLTEIRPCLASGLLVNRGCGTPRDPEDDADVSLLQTDLGPQCAGYNILWIGSSARPGASTAAFAQTPVQTPTGGQISNPVSATTAFAQGIATSAQQPGTPITASGPTAAALAGAAMRVGGPSLEPILKEYLTMYRGLGLLARVRGLRGTKGGTLPWHIVVATNSVAALERCM